MSGEKGWCVHCGGWIAQLQTNRDHVPSKSLLQRPYPANLPVIDVCMICNNGFARDEEYVAAFLGCVLCGSTEVEKQVNPRLARTLARGQKLRRRIERARVEYKTIGGEVRSVWKPEWERVNSVVLKNARGHAFYELGEPMLGKRTMSGLRR